MSIDYEPGSTISHFRLEKMLGQGGMGAVYLAEDLTLSRPVAIKFMNRELVAQQANPKMRENIEQRFIREARSAAAINHPNLAQIYEANFDSDTWFIAMEFINGASIADYLEENVEYTVPQIINFASQVVSGLMFAWDNYKIIHRDIKPQNIMVTTTNIIKIVDLGLAKPMDTTDPDYDMPELTNAGVPIGTPHYMAPEQATGEVDVDFLADIYALGATIYEVIAGQKAFSGATAPMIYMAQIQKKYEPLENLRADVPQELTDLVYKMLEPERPDRISSYGEILEALARMQGGGSPGEFTSVPGGAAMGNDPTMAAPAQYSTFEVDQLILERFRVLKFIGESSAGVVYHCMDTKAGVECAVKSLWPGREFPAAEMPRVKENIQRLLRMSHPNLVHVRDLISDDASGELFVIMELLSGRNLRSWVHEKNIELGGITVADLQVILDKVATAVDEINTKFSIVHHDLKPESIYLVDNDTQVRLLDYGITYCSPDKDAHRGDKNIFKYPLATPDYLSPEIWQKQEVTQRADQYSFAVMVYEMLGHRLPFWLKNPKSIEVDKADKGLSHEKKQLKHLYKAVLEDAPDPIETISKQENAAILKALSKDPSLRFGSCTEFVQVLSRKGMPAVVKLGIAAAILVLLGVGGFVAMGGAGNDGSSQQARIPTATVRAQPAGTTTSMTLPTTVPSGTVDPVPPDSGNDLPMPPDTGNDTDVTADATAAAAAQAANKAAAEEEAATLDAAIKAAAEEAAAQAAAEEAAELEQVMAKFAAEQKRKQVEAQRLERRRKASVQRDNLRKLLKDGAEDPDMAAMLGDLDGITATAEKLFEQEKYEMAITVFKQAIDAMHDMENQLKTKKKEAITELKRDAEAALAGAGHYKGIDPSFEKAFVDADVSMSLAGDYSAQEQFDPAMKEYQKVIDIFKQVIATGSEKFTGTIGKNWTVPIVGMDMIWIDKVKVWVGKFEVTNAQYRKFKRNHDSKKAEGFSLNDDNQPVIEVSYYDSLGFCAWLNTKIGREFVPEGHEFRLPTKEEWQKCATTGIERLYPWGNDWPPPNGNYGNQEVFPESWQLDGYTDKFPVTCNVADSSENDWGLFGASGNVWEWTSDEKDGKRAVFGGAWTSTNKKLLVVNPKGFNYATVEEPYDNIGFRIVIGPSE